MRKQTNTIWPDFGALWSLVWRAVLLTPFAMVVGGLWLVTWPLLILLPVCEVLYLFNHEWLGAAIVPPVWLALFFLARSRWFKANRADFPNEQENV